MTASQTQIENCAKKLSKIPLPNNGRLEKDIEGILGYIEKLDEVDTTGVTPTFSVIHSRAPLRADELKNPTQATPAELLNCSAQKVAGDQIILPNIMH